MSLAVTTVVVYIPKDAPLEYVAAHSTIYLPKSEAQARIIFPKGFRRVVTTITTEELP